MARSLFRHGRLHMYFTIVKEKVAVSCRRQHRFFVLRSRVDPSKTLEGMSIPFFVMFFVFVGLSSRRFYMQTMRLVLRNTIVNECACFVLCFAIGKRDCAFAIVFCDSKRMCGFYFCKCHFFDSCDWTYCCKYVVPVYEEKKTN